MPNKTIIKRKPNQNPIASDRLKTQYERLEDVVVIRFQGELDLYSAFGFSRALDKVRDLQVTRFLFDLSELTYVDSSGMGLLVRTNQEMKEQKGQFLCILPSNVAVKRILSQHWLRMIVPFVENHDEALVKLGFAEGEAQEADSAEDGVEES